MLHPQPAAELDIIRGRNCVSKAAARVDHSVLNPGNAPKHGFA